MKHIVRKLLFFVVVLFFNFVNGQTTVTRIITDFGGFWDTNTTANNPVYPNNSHNLLAFEFGGQLYSTGVNNTTLSNNGITYSSGNYKALPAILNGVVSGSSNLIVAGAKKDGTISSALFTHPSIRDLTMESVLTDGINGLDLGTGYTNLTSGTTSNFIVNSIIPSKITDNEPDLVFTQIADPSGTAFDKYKFLDASGNIVGQELSVSYQSILPLGTYYLDLFSVTSGLSLSVGKPTGVFSIGNNTTRQIRLIAFKLSDFGITTTNYSQIRTLVATSSGVSDCAFVAYNANAINVPPSISQNTQTTSSVICTTGVSNAYLEVYATAAASGALSYSWEVSTDGGTNWSAVTNGATYSGTLTKGLTIRGATQNYKYRAIVTESGTGYSSISPVFTITSASSTALLITTQPTNLTPCLNIDLSATPGTTSISVVVSGGITTSRSYQWYSNTSNNNSGGALISGATSSTFYPPLNISGVKYYYVVVSSGCYTITSNVSTVTVTGETITSVTNGSNCTTGTVTLSATASGGDIKWYNVSSGGTSLVTSSTYTTPSISSTTTYYVDTTSGSCISPRVPVVATIATASFTSANFTIGTIASVCPGTGATVNISSSSPTLQNGTFTISYTIDGGATTTATLTMAEGVGSFITAPLTATGTSNLVITGIEVNSCTIGFTSANTKTITVLAGPSISSIFVDVSDGCSNINSIVTISSTTLTTGTYVVTYSVTGSNSVATTTAQINYTAGTGGTYGTGTFTLPTLGNVGDANKVYVTGLQILGSSCIVNPNKFSENFARNATPLIDAGAPVIICANDDSVNITEASSAQNYSALVWSTSDGTGTFTFNTTEDALTNTRYAPSAAERAAANANGTKVIFLTLTGIANSGCANIAKTITLTIKAAPSGGTLTPNDITGGKRLTLSGHSGTILRWEYASNSSFDSNITNVSNTSTTLDAVGLTQTRYYRAVLSNAGNCIAYSSVVAVGTGGSISVDNATVCAGNNTVNLTLSGNSGTIVKWQSSASSNFTSPLDINTQEAILTINNLSITTYYRAVVNIDGTDYTSSFATVTVNPASVGGSVSGSTIVCIGVNSTVLSLSGRTGSIVKWQSCTSSDFTSNVVDIANTNASITVTNLLVPTYYRAVVKSGICDSAFSSFAFININDTNYWTGATGDTKWHTPGNWSCNSVPTINTNVIINEIYYNTNNSINIFSDAVAKSITMASGNNPAVLTLTAGQDLSVSNNLDIATSATFIIKNTANLFQNSNTNTNLGSIQVEKQSSPLFRFDYVMWSSPVSGSQPLGFVSGATTQTGFSPLTATNRFYFYNTATNFFNPVSSASTFTTAKGYLIRMPNNWISYAVNATPLPWLGIFKGVPNTGNITYPLELTGTRYNFVGNPYPSSIDLQAFMDANVNNIEETIWIWRKTNDRTNGSSYSTLTRNGGKSLANQHVYNYDKYLAPGQGFIVKAKSGASNLIFNNSMRSSENVSQFFRTLPPVVNRFWIDLLDENDESYNQHMLSYNQEATLGYDDGYDGKFINDTPIALVSSIENTELVIQARPVFDSNDVVPMLFKTNVSGNFKVKLTNFEGVFVDQDIYVLDNVQGIVHNLKLNDYNFTSEAGIFSSRFEILYNSTLGNNDFDDNFSTVFVADNLLTIQSDIHVKDFYVYDIRGRLLIEKLQINAANANFDVSNLANEVLLVKLRLENGVLVTKKVIK